MYHLVRMTSAGLVLVNQTDLAYVQTAVLEPAAMKVGSKSLQFL